MTKAKIIFRDNAPYEEVVDSISDGFGVIFEVEQSLKDGWQLTDFLVYLKQEPIIREAINDFPAFIDQFVKLTPQTAADATQEAYNRTKAKYGTIGKYGEVFFAILKQVALTYGFGVTTVEAATNLLAGWKTIITPAPQA